MKRRIQKKIPEARKYTIEKQELHCHECDKYVQFEIDVSLNGNHVITCPNCKHEHCRVVKDGIITSERWDQRNAVNFYISAAATTYTTLSITSTTASTTSASLYLSGLWAQSTATTY